jgi:hypothetical protein
MREVANSAGFTTPLNRAVVLFNQQSEIDNQKFPFASATFFP